MNKHFTLFGIVLIVFSSTIAVSEPLPEEVQRRFESIIFAADDDDFAGSFIMTTDTVIQKPNGKKKQEASVVLKIERHADGTKSTKLVRMIVDGEDVTEKSRDKFEDELSNEDQENDDDGFDLSLPFGDEPQRHDFGPVSRIGETFQVDFIPKKQYLNDEGIASGRLAWNAETLDPLWAELSPIRPPKPMNEMLLKMEFVRLHDRVFMKSMLTDGKVKILLLKRDFHLDIRFSEFEVSSPF